MTEYRVAWQIDETADDPVTAARQAKTRQLDPDTYASVFQVSCPTGEACTVDLSEPDPEPDYQDRADATNLATSLADLATQAERLTALISADQDLYEKYGEDVEKLADLCEESRGLLRLSRAA
jgi:hypothetical protein